MTTDELITGFDRALRTLAGTASSQRPNPAAGLPEETLAPEERRHAGGLMRVNHTGEICAQALYQAQALTARNPDVRARFVQAAREEEDHLAWAQERLEPRWAALVARALEWRYDHAPGDMSETLAFIRYTVECARDWPGSPGMD